MVVCEAVLPRRTHVGGALRQHAACFNGARLPDQRARLLLAVGAGLLYDAIAKSLSCWIMTSLLSRSRAGL
jgi:hypothetical protein